LGPNQLVQTGTLVKLDVEAKKPYGGFFWTKFLIKKVKISCNEFSSCHFGLVLIFFFLCEKGRGGGGGGVFCSCEFWAFFVLLFWSFRVFNFSCHFVGFKKIVWSFTRGEKGGVFAFLFVNFKSFLFSYLKFQSFQKKIYHFGGF